MHGFDSQNIWQSNISRASYFLIWDNLGQHQDKWIFWATCPTDKLFSNPAPNTVEPVKQTESRSGRQYGHRVGYTNRLEPVKQTESRSGTQ